jgi:hypothetical protein
MLKLLALSVLDLTFLAEYLRHWVLRAYRLRGRRGAKKVILSVASYGLRSLSHAKNLREAYDLRAGH